MEAALTAGRRGGVGACCSRWKVAERRGHGEGRRSNYYYYDDDDSPLSEFSCAEDMHGGGGVAEGPPKVSRETMEKYST